MKKLIVMAVAAVACIAANAASYSWSCTGSKTVGTIYNYTGSSKVAAGLEAVLIDATFVSQSTLLAAARTDGFILADYCIPGAGTTVDSSSKIANVEFSWDYDGPYYFAILDSANEQLLISATQPGTAQEVGTFPISYASNVATFSKTSMGDADYSVAGWYSTASVPEPTSGLLLLLGMAGLALKRSRLR